MSSGLDDRAREGPEEDRGEERSSWRRRVHEEEPVDREELLTFYEREHFWPFDRRTAIGPSDEPHDLIQLLRILK